MIFYNFGVKKNMGSKTKTILRAISILIVLFIVLMQLGIITLHVPAINENRMWLMIIAYGLLLVTLR
jgi:uncharacterized membrane protein